MSTIETITFGLFIALAFATGIFFKEMIYGELNDRNFRADLINGYRDAKESFVVAYFCIQVSMSLVLFWGFDKNLIEAVGIASVVYPGILLLGIIGFCWIYLLRIVFKAIGYIINKFTALISKG